jgi:hypothetical protein
MKQAAVSRETAIKPAPLTSAKIGIPPKLRNSATVV